MRKDKKEQNEIARPVGKHFAQVMILRQSLAA